MARHYRRPSYYPASAAETIPRFDAREDSHRPVANLAHGPTSLEERCAGSKSHRFLSDWADDVVVIDTARVRGQKSPRSIDLTALILDCTGDKSIYEVSMPLTHFRSLVDATKIAINTVLERNNRGNVWVAVTRALRTMLRIYVWMMRSGVYELKDLTQSMIDELIVNLSQVQWGRILRYHRSLVVLWYRAKADPVLAARLHGVARKDRKSPVNIIEIERAAGIPMPDDAIPPWFRRRIARANGDPRPVDHKRRDFFRPSTGELRETMMVFNLLALHPIGGDSVLFMPYANVEGRLAELTTEEPGRTENLDVSTCMKLMNECLLWLYDRGPLVVELLCAMRSALETTGSEAQRNRRAAAAVSAHYAAERSRFNMPYENICLDRGPASLTGLVKTSQAAMALIIGLNHGRRTNEIVGTEVPWGLYFGALRSAGDGYNDWSVEFFIEKGIQDYVTFAANELVADATALLHDIYAEYRPLGTKPPIVPKSREAGRSSKLFAFRSPSVAGFNAKKPFQFHQRVHMEELFRLADCDISLFHGSQLPLRRMFVTLYFNRYDCAELPAMSRHLGHLSVRSTLPYYTDNPGRRPDKRISNTIAKRQSETKNVIKAMKEGETAYLEKLVEDCFVGRDTSGLFPFLILKLTKRLSASVEFRVAPLEDKVKQVAGKLERRGYLPTVHQHGPCMAKSPRHTLKMSNCFKDGAIHRENASPSMCKGCVHFHCTDGYLAQWQEDADLARAESNDFNFPIAVRAHKAEHADFMEALIDSERQVSKRVSDLFQKLTASWSEFIEGQAT